MNFDLSRFVDAQAPVIDRVMAELRRGRKASHWMWFIFPQIEGLGHSVMAAHFALASLDEARAYLRDPLLGPRLKACTQLVLDVKSRSAHEIFGSPDDVKFCSSMTLFAAAEEEKLFAAALEKYYGGERDDRTLQILRKMSDGL